MQKRSRQRPSVYKSRGWQARLEKFMLIMNVLELVIVTVNISDVGSYS